MRLISIHIENFGKLSDVDFEFDKGINIICRENGWGKSTLAAFIKAMFYGLGGDSKKTVLENERKRYKPWQGGVFGGRLVFEARGNIYDITRVFGEKDAEDIFEIRDHFTNLPTKDYTAKIGEELFGIDAVSFLRTIFIKQNDMVTAATDSVNSKVGRLLDDSEDLKCYESAVNILTEKVNALNSRRAMGSLSKRKSEIAKVDREVKEGKDLRHNLEELEKKISGLRQKQEQIKDKLKENGEVYKKISESKAVSTLQGEWNRLEGNCKAKEKERIKCREAFKTRVPSKQEIDDVLEACGKLTRKEAERDTYSVDIREGEKIKNDLSKAKSERNSKGLLIAGAVFLIIGMGLLISGIVFSILGLVIPGAFLLVTGIADIVAGKLKADKEKEKYGEALKQNEAFEKRKENYDKLDGECSKLFKVIEEFYKSIGINVGENINTQLLGLRDMADDYYDALKDENEARKIRDEFEKKHKEDLEKKIEDGLPLALDIEKQKESLEKELDDNRTLLLSYEGQLNEIREKLDEWEDNAVLLKNLKQLQAEEKLEFDRVSMARNALEKAKSNMTSRYVGPILSSFKKYYSAITGKDAGSLHIDANTKVTIDEAGLQRDTGLFSTGIKDMIGVALRISLADAMYPDELPMLIMDDPFVNLDDRKLDNTKAFMKEVSSKYQVLYFTCSESRQI